MEDPTDTPRGLPTLAGHVVRRLLHILENRFALLSVELQEERDRVLRDVLLALGVAAFGLLSCLTLTAALILLLSAYSPVQILLVLAALYAVAAGGLAWRLMCRLRAWESLSSSLQQIRKDREAVDQLLP